MSVFVSVFVSVNVSVFVSIYICVYKVTSGLSTGFPKKAKFDEIEEDYNKLWRATTFDDEKYDRIKVSKDSCSIL